MGAEKSQDRSSQEHGQQRGRDQQARCHHDLAAGQPGERHGCHFHGGNSGREHSPSQRRFANEPAGQPRQQRQDGGCGGQHQDHAPRSPAHAVDIGECHRRAGTEHQHRQGNQDRSVGIQAPSRTRKRNAQPGGDQNQGQEKSVKEPGQLRKPGLATGDGVTASHSLTVPERCTTLLRRTLPCSKPG